MKPEELVDIILDGKYNTIKKGENLLKKHLNSVSEQMHRKHGDDDEECVGEDCGKLHSEATENDIDEVPDQNIDKLKSSIEDEVLEQNEIDNEPNQEDRDAQLGDVARDIGEAVENEIDEEPEEKTGTAMDQIEKDIAENLIDDIVNSILNEESEYQKFFKKELGEYGVTSPAQLDSKKKKEFFDHIDKEWKAEKESD